MDLSKITTKDVIAVMVVGAVLVFNGISMAFDKPLDAGTLGMAGIIVGHYFGSRTVEPSGDSEPLPEPFTGDKNPE